MPCKELQTKIAVHDPLTPDERRHAETCSECAAFAAFDATLGARLEGWRDPGAAPVRRSPARPFRLAYAGVGLAAALAFAALAIPARSTAATAYRRMLGRIHRVHSVHLVVAWRPGDGRPQDGPPRRVYELWWKPGAWREAGEGARPSLKRVEPDGLMFYRYDPETRRVERMHEVAAQPDFATFDLASFAGRYMDAPARFEQPSPTTIVATNAGDWSRMVFTVDPATGLPTHAEKQSRGVGGAWSMAGRLDMAFDAPIPAVRFAPEDLIEAP